MISETKRGVHSHLYSDVMCQEGFRDLKWDTMGFWVEGENEHIYLLENINRTRSWFVNWR